MSSNAMITRMNAVLDPFLFQVVGSTPESVRDSIKNSTLKNNPDVAATFACACIFASAVNKATMEGFISKPELSDARPVISSAFSIQGRANMTGMTLLGHCILTTSFATGLTFAVEFRKKMGQDNLWDGNLASGSLSDKQKEILAEKKRVTPKDSAMLLGSGFLKFTGIVREAYTAKEAEFWGETASGHNIRETTSPGGPSSSRAGAPSGKFAASPPRAQTSSKMYTVALEDGTAVQIPRDVAEYYLAVNNDEEDRLRTSVTNRGVKDFVEAYRRAMENDPERKGGSGGTVFTRR